MNFQEYVDQAGMTVEILGDGGAQSDADGWEHHSFTVRLENPQTGKAIITPWRQGLGITASPVDSAAEVADSLLSDVWSFQQARDFEDWANEFGYDTDSRKAEKIYQTIAALEPAVVQLFGGQQAFEHVATEIERL